MTAFHTAAGSAADRSAVDLERRLQQIAQRLTPCPDTGRHRGLGPVRPRPAVALPEHRSGVARPRPGPRPAGPRAAGLVAWRAQRRRTPVRS